jgi:alpha-D-ribose 1-methylphosphonate 5-triphosphate synthase subunit PhnG
VICVDNQPEASNVADVELKTPRQNWMGVLARSTSKEVAALVASLGVSPAYEVIKRPETGTIMLEARAGGAGRRFNAGEATMTRCVVRLTDGTMGFSYALGRDRQKAEHAALIDAILQTDPSDDGTLLQKIDALAKAQHAVCEQRSRKAAATKVNFFTLVRGDG